MMTKPRVSVSNRIRELGDDEECNQLLRTIPVHRAELLGPLFSQDQVNEFRGWPLRWAGQTIELATRLELCRPGANGGNPLNPGPYLSFLDELPEELAVPRRDRQALEAVMRTPAPAIAKNGSISSVKTSSSTKRQFAASPKSQRWSSTADRALNPSR